MKKYPGAWVKLIAFHHAAGLSPRQIAEKLHETFGANIDGKSVYKHMWRAGIANTRPQKVVWTDERKDRLRELHVAQPPFSFEQIARKINTEFGTSFTRNSVISISKRMGLAGKFAGSSSLRYNPDGSIRPAQGRKYKYRPSPLTAARREVRERIAAERDAALGRPPVEVIKLRCVELAPLHIKLIDLEKQHCRWPYGGEDSPASTTYCGHQHAEGSSYCQAHLHLSLAPLRTFAPAIRRRVA